MAKVLRILKKIKPSDFTVVILVVALVIFGVVMVFSASYYNSLNDTGSPYGYLKKQLFFAVTGFVIMYIMSIVDYHIFKKLAVPLVIISIILLLLLFTGLGLNVNGATRWIRLGPLSIMPGEIAKVAVIAYVAFYLSPDPKRVLSIKEGILPMLLLAGVFGILIIKQPNLSTAITVVGIIFGMMFLAGLEWKWIIGAIVIGGGGLLALSRTGTYWGKRLTSFVNPFQDPQGDGFQAVQSLLALGTGGLFGLGLGKSVQKNLYLPEPQNDFILAIIGEELGLVGVLILLTVFAVLIWRCFIVTMNAPDRFGMLLAGGITLMIGIQVILNVAVVTSSMPPTGIALPFVSYGGNALWIMMGATGVLLNVSRKSVSAAKPAQAERPARKHDLRREYGGRI
jgi:cell division protein FtsW